MVVQEAHRAGVALAHGVPNHRHLGGVGPLPLQEAAAGSRGAACVSAPHNAAQVRFWQHAARLSAAGRSDMSFDALAEPVRQLLSRVSMQLYGQQKAWLGLCPCPAGSDATQHMWLSKLHLQDSAAALRQRAGICRLQAVWHSAAGMTVQHTVRWEGWRDPVEHGAGSFGEHHVRRGSGMQACCLTDVVTSMATIHSWSECPRTASRDSSLRTSCGPALLPQSILSSGETCSRGT